MYMYIVGKYQNLETGRKDIILGLWCLSYNVVSSTSRHEQDSNLQRLW